MISDPVVHGSQGASGHRNEQATRHMPLVRRIAQRLLARLPANVELDDLVQAGMIGLMEAVERFDQAHGIAFEAYATSRVRGAMLDELRAGDWLPRSARRSQRDIEGAIHRLEQRLQRAPGEAEIAGELHLTVAGYRALVNSARGAQIVHFDDLGVGGEGEDYLERHAIGTAADPSQVLFAKRFQNALADSIEPLPERERQLMSMYYEQDMNLREIGAVMGVTESRACQLHSRAVSRLRAKLRNW